MLVTRGVLGLSVRYSVRHLGSAPPNLNQVSQRPRRKDCHVLISLNQPPHVHQSSRDLLSSFTWPSHRQTWTIAISRLLGRGVVRITPFQFLFPSKSVFFLAAHSSSLDSALSASAKTARLLRAARIAKTCGLDFKTLTRCERDPTCHDCRFSPGLLFLSLSQLGLPRCNQYGTCENGAPSSLTRSVSLQASSRTSDSLV